MNVEEILTRADVKIFTDKDPLNNNRRTTWVVSNSTKPLTREEAKIIEKMKRNHGDREKIVFIPPPKKGNLGVAEWLVMARRSNYNSLKKFSNRNAKED